MSWIAWVWGLGGVVVLLLQALVRLAPVAAEPVQMGMAGWQWGLYCASVMVNAYAEGYRGFHLRFSRRVVARAGHLSRHPTALRLLFAPLFCMSFFHASRRGLITAWVVSAAIVGLVLCVRAFAQPYRGIVDAGVVAGLGLGVLSIVAHVLRGTGQEHPPDLPTDDVT